jgi:ATP-dependent DNA helicase RecG
MNKNISAKANIEQPPWLWLNEGESETVEFKAAFGSATIETLAAFANTKGGVVLLGVSDRGEIVGVTLSKESVNQWINEIKSKTSPQLVPDVTDFNIDDKTVVCMAIPEYPVKPVACKGRYFKRNANANHQLSSGEVANLHLKTVNSSWDCYVREDVSMDDISLEKVRAFIDNVQKRNVSVADNPLSLLFKYRLVKETQVTNACYLLFAKENNLYATIELGFFENDTVIKDSARVKADLFTEVEEVMTFIRKNIRKEIIITGEPQNTERWEYPLTAIRELVLNMIVHRDYTSPYDSIVKVFPDKIELYNPGALPDNISIQQLVDDAYVSQPRNKLIAEMFKESGFIEKYGSGIKRVITAFAEMNLPTPDFIATPSGFKVIAYGKARPKKIGEAVENVPENVPENGSEIRLNAIIKLIENRAEISMIDLSNILQVTHKTIKRDVEKLKAKGLLERVGPDKGGYWRVKI